VVPTKIKIKKDVIEDITKRVIMNRVFLNQSLIMKSTQIKN